MATLQRETHTPTPQPTSSPGSGPSDRERFRRSARRAELGNKALRVALWVVLLTGVVVFMLPVWVMIVLSLKSPNEIATTPIYSWPSTFTWANVMAALQDGTAPGVEGNFWRAQFANYIEVLTNENAPFKLFFQNTLLISTLTTLGVVFTSAMVAYPFARLKFRGRDRLFVLLLSTMMLPGVVTMIPTYVLFAQLRWVDTFYPLIVPAFFGGGAFNIFLLRQFFMGIPRDLDEAAILDGASHAVIFWRVILPNSGAALATVGVFCFIYNWRDFMGPLLYLNSPERQTLEVGLNTYRALQSEQWNFLMAGSTLVMIPLFLIFLLGQKYFVRGIVMSGLK